MVGTAWSAWRKNHLVGWRFGVTSCAVWTVIVLLVNISLLTASVTKYPRNKDLENTGYTPTKGSTNAGNRLLYEGDCQTTRNLSTALHLVINSLSTILLSASNYCMQCLSAPTRNEIDRAHSKSKWLDIGVLSVRNLRQIKYKRVALWVLILASSLPIHLFYNSAIFTSIAAVKYGISETSKEFVSEPDSSPLTVFFARTYHSDIPDLNATNFGFHSTVANNITNLPFSLTYRDDPQIVTSRRLRTLARNGTLQTLKPIDCINQYAVSFSTRWENLILIRNRTIDTIDGVTLVWKSTAGDHVASPYYPFEWICSQLGQSSRYCSVSIDKIRQNSSQWTPYNEPDYLYPYDNAPVVGCLSESGPGRCRLQTNTQIYIVVIIMNAMKAVAMIYLAFSMREEPILTIGDAISSFLETPDRYSAGLGMVSKYDVQNYHSNWASKNKVKRATIWDGAPERCSSAGRLRWFLCILLYIGVLICVIYFMSLSIQSLRDQGSLTSKIIWQLGLGAIDTRTLLESNQSYSSSGTGSQGQNLYFFLSTVLKANSPQVVLSFIYFTYNSLFTSMAATMDWSKFLEQRKGLRVSSIPQGDQRGTYMLQLPFRTAIPLMVLSVLLHWLVSQSFFIVNVEGYENGHRYFDWDILSCGFSPLAIILLFVVCLVMFSWLIRMGLRNATSAMPLVGSCSVAIAAACHPGRGNDKEDAYDKIQWGVMEMYSSSYGHCGFSSREVSKPDSNASYI